EIAERFVGAHHRPAVAGAGVAPRVVLPGRGAGIAVARDHAERPAMLAGADVVRAHRPRRAFLARGRILLEHRRADDDDVADDERHTAPAVALAGLVQVDVAAVAEGLDRLAG